jgi:glucose-6-phosphate 1-dehydrogenase
MGLRVKGQPAVIAIFGASGDLTQRKLIPALFNLYLDKQMPKEFTILGISRKGDADSFKSDMREAISNHSRRGDEGIERWDEFAARIDYISGDYADAAVYKKLSKRISVDEDKWGERAAHVYYLSVPPEVFPVIADHLGESGLSKDRDYDRIVIEKPFGRDLDSAEDLNKRLMASFRERQVYRIDHYLGKETVQNLLAFRFANTLYEPIWNRRYVDHVQITVSEEGGVEKRGGYYESSGALRDMIQNHLLQLVCLVGMEPPTSFDSDEVRNKKVDVLRAVRPIEAADLASQAIRGQYGSGHVDGKEVVAYRQEEGVDPNSSTETYAALKLNIDNWRWQGVPFYLRTGKRMPKKISEIVIQFRPVPHLAFPPSSLDTFEANRLTINIQPDEGISLCFQAKEPGAGMRLRTVAMDFNYREAFHMDSREAYETLLQEVLLGDTSLFMRADQEHEAWRIVMPVIEAWESRPSSSFPNYDAGTWGPERADQLLARDGRSWHNPR